MTSVVDHMFPPLDYKEEIEGLTEFTSFNYWRDVLPEIQIEIEKDRKKQEEKLKPSSSPKSPPKK